MANDIDPTAEVPEADRLEQQADNADTDDAAPVVAGSLLTDEADVADVQEQQTPATTADDEEYPYDAP